MKVSELFTLYQGNSFEFINMEIDKQSEINFVARTGENNGVAAKINAVDTIASFPAGFITVALGGSVLSSFVQRKPFYTGFHVMVLEPKKEMRLEEKLFYCHCIKMNAYRYRYGRQANKTLKDIELPELPDWLNLFAIDYSRIETKIEKKTLPFDITKWMHFKMDDIFTLSIAASSDLGSLEYGNVPFIGRTENNNGLQAFVSTGKINKGRCITVSMVGTFKALWQEHDFAASQNILLLRNSSLNVHSALFVVTIINVMIKNKYSYNRPIQKIKFVDNVIMLPVDKAGSPDWQFMENYIKALPYSDKIADKINNEKQEKTKSA
jgi:hypothetical protein